jgi:hypothetical protein
MGHTPDFSNTDQYCGTPVEGVKVLGSSIVDFGTPSRVNAF